MQIQRYNNYQNNPHFSALYIEPEQIEKVVGKRFAKEAIDAIPRLKELAKDVDIEIGTSINRYFPEDIGLRGFKYCVSPIKPQKTKSQNPIKRFFSRITNKTPYVSGEMRFADTSPKERAADNLVNCVIKAKDKFIKLGGLD